MLGLRPRLKARPSLLDLITKKDIDQLSSHPAPLSPLKAADTPNPLSTRLPETPFEEQKELAVQKEKKTDTLKMAPVRTVAAGCDKDEAKTDRHHRSSKTRTMRCPVCD